jgi:hypothetical protein
VQSEEPVTRRPVRCFLTPLFLLFGFVFPSSSTLGPVVAVEEPSAVDELVAPSPLAVDPEELEILGKDVEVLASPNSNFKHNTLPLCLPSNVPSNLPVLSDHTFTVRSLDPVMMCVRENSRQYTLFFLLLVSLFRFEKEGREEEGGR